MKAFYNSQQAAHNPQKALRLGRFVSARDLPQRISSLRDAALDSGFQFTLPRDTGLEPILEVHSPDYIRFLQTAWSKWTTMQGHGDEVMPNYMPSWDGLGGANYSPLRTKALIGQVGWYLGDLAAALGPDTFSSALASAQSAVAGADEVIDGSRICYALCRPSGHHARRSRASGSCFLNNSAIAATRLRQKFRRVAILDIDVHHGDGTQQLFYEREDILTVSLHVDPKYAYPFYTGYADEIGLKRGQGFNLNCPLESGTSFRDYQPELLNTLEFISKNDVEALVVGLGFDALKYDPVNWLNLDVDDFGKIAKLIRQLNLPTLLVQEGGYAIEHIGSALQSFLSEF